MWQLYLSMEIYIWNKKINDVNANINNDVNDGM
jgi:hypothetical protein